MGRMLPSAVSNSDSGLSKISGLDGRPDKAIPQSGTRLDERWRAQLRELGYRNPERPIVVTPLTVGALDQHQTADPSDDTVPSWSAYGKTMDGFHKPDVSAPGRYMVAPVPSNASICLRDLMPTSFRRLPLGPMMMPFWLGRSM